MSPISVVQDVKIKGAIAPFSYYEAFIILAISEAVGL